jgi:hypothetical protein
MTTVLTDLQALGYEVHAHSDRLHVQWLGEGKPPRAQVLPLVEELKRCKPEILRLLSGPAATVEGHKGSDHPKMPHPRNTNHTDGEESATPERTMPNDLRQACRGVDGEATKPDAEPRAHDALGITANDVTPALETTRCGWCGAGTTRFLHMATEAGPLLDTIFCECRAVYNPSKGDWSPGEDVRRGRGRRIAKGLRRRRPPADHVADRLISAPVPVGRGTAMRRAAKALMPATRSARPARLAHRRPRAQGPRRGGQGPRPPRHTGRHAP